MDSDLLKAFSLALGLGLLIGLQRERSGSDIGGIRTYPLLAMLGLVCGVMSREWSPVIAAAGFLAVVALVLIANMGKRDRGESLSGQTSEAAALLTYALGALLALEHYAAVLVIGGLTAVLLHLKEPLHEFTGKLSEAEVRAIMRLAIVSLVILPLLPDEAFGPYEVLNPREIWLMVVLIVALGLTGYVSYKFFGGKVGTIAGGILGGLVSSTATTVAYARRTRASRAGLTAAAVVIAIAWSVSVARVIVEVVVVAPGLAGAVVPPLAMLLATVVLASAALWLLDRRGAGAMPDQKNPAELRSAIAFGAIYGIVILATAAARESFGEGAIYAVAIVSGVVDVDAITLSTARLGAAGRVEPPVVWKVVLLASLSNVAFKACAVLALGSSALFVRLLPVIAVTLAAGAALLLFWPA